MSRKTSIILSILPLVFLTVIVFHFSLDLPYWDQWEFVPLLEKSYQGTLSFNDFWVPHNEHRPVFPRVIMLGLARLTNWNIRYELALNILLAIGIYTVVLKSFLKLKNSKFEYRNSKQYQISNDQNPKRFEHLIIRILNLFRISDFALRIYLSIILFSLTQWENWVWGWQIQIFLNVFAVCLGFYFLTKSTHSTSSGLILSRVEVSKDNKALFIASIICGIVGTFSFANGLLFWPIGFFILISLAKSDLARLTWLLISIIIYAIYLPGLNNQFDLLSIINNLLLYLSYVTAFLGAPVFGLQLQIASLFGVLGLGIFLISSRRSRSVFFLSLGLYAILSAFFIGLGRYNLGGLQAISSRYITFGNLLWLTNIIFLYQLSKSCISDLNHWYKLFARISRLTIYLIVFLITATSLYRIKTITKRYNDLIVAQTALINGTDDSLLKKLYYSGEVVKERMKFLNEKFNK